MIFFKKFLLFFLPLILCVSLSFGQGKEVKGSVSAADENIALAGVSVVLKGTNRGTSTNNAGEFSLRLTDAEFKDAVLVFTSAGYYKQELRLAGRIAVNIVLQKNIQELKDVVVTNAYTRPKRKEEVVGSIVTVSSQELQTSRPIESFDKMLEGLAAGVQVETNTELGTPVKINIRGQNSLTNLFTGNDRAPITTSSQPLFIVDGVPIIEQRRGDEPIQLSNEQLLNPLAGLNPDDIESISVLKDAAAAAIYGANGSNGVIIITTKKGRAGKTRVNLGYSYGWSQPINQIKWLDGKQYQGLLKEMYTNEGRSPFDAEILAGPSDINTPWFQLTNQYGIFNNIDFDLSGGNENTQFRFSTSYLDQQAIQRGNDFKKTYLRLRVDHTINKKMSIGLTLAPSFTKKNGLNVYSNVPIIPNVPAYNADGSFYQLSNLVVPNPLAVLAQNVDNAEGGTINGNVRLEYKPFNQLRLSSSFGIDGLVNKQNVFRSGKNATGSNVNGSAQIYDRTNFSWISFSQADYTPTLKNGHKLDVTVGFEAQSQSTKLLRGSGTGFSYYRLNELSNAQNQSAASSIQTGSSYSIYGQSAYSYEGKYFANVSGRYDAASIFGSDVNGTVNASSGFGWVISKENFLSKADFIDMLRLRVSYGTTGNSRIGSYEARGLYNFSNSGYYGNVGAYPATAPNPDLSWEKSYKTNIGLDFNFNKRFNLTIDVYQNIVDDAISLVRVPVETGFAEVLANVAKMRNRGLDASFNAQILRGTFTWNSTLNAGFNKNIVLEVKNNAERFVSNDNPSALKAGSSTTALWGFRYAGVDPATGVELFYDREGKISTAALLDRRIGVNGTALGDRLPKVQGGFINNFSYKGATLTINILYSIGGYRFADYINEFNGRNLDNRNQSVNLLDRWQKPGDITNIPQLRRDHPIVYNSTRFLYEDTYLKLSNVSLAYVIPQKWFGKLKGVRSTVFVNGTNLAYWYKEKSPKDRNGLKEYKFNFPESQTFTWGVRLGF